MVDRYSFARSRVTAKLKEFNSGVVTLTRGSDVYTLYARVDGVIADYINGTTILATDRMIIAATVASLDGVDVAIEPRKTDGYSIDGKRAVAKEIKAAPASADAAVYHIVVGS